MFRQRKFSSFRARGNGQRRNFGQFRKPKYIDPSFFVKKATGELAPDFIPLHQFSDFAIDSRLKENIVGRGYTIPTPIQDQAIPELLLGRDVIGIANTGTGKTAAFLIPLINKILADRNQKVLIVTPTRELATQIEGELKEFARNLSINSVLTIGGVGIGPQIHRLRASPNFVIGTPGRIKDLEERHAINLKYFQNIVLDEVDRMLDMGFINDIKIIIGKLPQERHSLFFSATMTENVRGIMQQFVKDPVTIAIRTTAPSANVDQDVVRVGGRNKTEVLHEYLSRGEFKKVLVFGRTKWGTERLARALSDMGHKVAAIHGNKTQGQRARAIDQFKRDQVRVLLATDVASRGLDIDDITHVINFDAPESHEDYIHRIGRTGRANKKGSALTFVE